ncbi:MAG: hypothetical protein NC133_03700 [Prevotella sp.]|nr:hypothetical protein [Prevotella sp.]
MHWGNLLLWGWDDLKTALNTGLSGVIYYLKNLFVSLLYNIWRVLAWLVSGIESVFRNLAGIGTSSTDMVQSILNDKGVSAIFQNLIALSMALIVFFTILKIIQEHYKEKDGGNPYKIVFRTFKGVLMFFFVQAAVVVALYASRVMFRALDAATGTQSSTSIAGQVFKTMAADANRKVIGRTEDGWTKDAMNMYWSRVADSQYVADDGKYMILEVTDKAGVDTSSRVTTQEYLDAFPAYRYGIVSQDGTSVTPLATWLSTQDFGSDIEDDVINNGFGFHQSDYWDRGETDGWDDDFAETGYASVSAGYQNDLLQGVSLAIRPTIELTWSPIDIWNYGYILKEDAAKKKEFDQNVTFGGTGVLIKMSLQYVDYTKVATTPKSLEESAKVFGINMKGGVSLQNSKASASFSLQMFEPEQFANILKTVVVNVAYTNLAQRLVEAIPTFPSRYNVGPLAIDFTTTFGPIIMDMLETCINTAMGYMIPEDEDGNPTVTAFATDGGQVSAGVWVSVNPKSKYFPLTIEQYKIDGNFKDLWSQLVDNYERFIHQLEVSNEGAWDAADGYKEVIQQMDKNIIGQENWQAYKALIDKYNDVARDSIVRLGSWLQLWEDARASANDDDTRNQYVADKSKNSFHTLLDLEDRIRNEFINLVDIYQSNIYHAYPSSSYADPKITMPLYQPILELHLTKNAASALAVSDIRDMFNGNTSKGTIKVNLLIDDNYREAENVAGIYRLVDWSQYGKLYWDDDNLKNVADLYSTTTHSNAVYEVHDLGDLAFTAIDDLNTSPDWDAMGVKYFINNSSIFKQSSTKNGSTKYKLASNSYWGPYGIVVNDSDPIYYAYTGTNLGVTKDIVTGIKDDLAAKKEANLATASVRTSSAEINLTTAASQNETSQAIADMANVDTTTELATDFAKHIITFRELYPSDTDTENGDKKVIDSWVETSGAINVRNDGKVQALYNWSASQIDDYMAASPDSRRYLVLSQNGSVDPSLSTLGAYVGRFSYSDTSTVNALYDFGSINYAVGYIAIVVAAGVYLNFSFGLIQRAVNMAVLYVMSPVTIAFYPFDDGQRFNQAFVSPFYKEAISAYAVILSLNLFIVMMPAVTKAVESTTSSSIIGWLGLVAFLSMLPKIRDQITSILGANKLESKSLPDMFKGAKNTLSEPFQQLKDVKSGALSASKRLREGVNRMAAHRQFNKDARMNHLEDLKAQNKLGWWGQRELNKLKGIDAQQQRIDKARATNSTAGLRPWDHFRMKKQDAIASMKAHSTVKKMDGESDEAYKGRVDAERKRLLSNSDFNKSVNGIVKSAKNLVLSPLTGAKKVAGGLQTATNWLANTRLGYAARTSLVGEMLSAEFGVNGRRAHDEKSLLGEWGRWHNVEMRANAIKDIQRKDRSYAAASMGYKDTLFSGLQMFAEKTNQADQAFAAGAKENVALTQVSANQDTKAKYTDLLTAKYIREGKSAAEARAAATKEVNNKKWDGVNLANEYAKLGGDQKYAQGIAQGLKEFEGASVAVDFKQLTAELNAAEKELRMKAMIGSKDLQVQIATKEKDKKANIENYANQMAGMLNKPEATGKIAQALSKVNRDTSFDDIVRQIQKQVGDVDAKDLEKALAANYQGFMDDVQFNTELNDLNIAKTGSDLNTAGNDLFRKKIGTGVDQAATDALARHFQNVNDANLNSVNPESLGYQVNEIIHQYKNGLDDPACRARVDELTNRLQAELTAELERYGAQNASAIREHDTAQKFQQDMRALPTNETMKEWTEQLKRQFEVNFDQPTVMAMLKDGHYQDRLTSAELSLLGTEMQQLVDAVKRHDTDAAHQVGFDQNFVDQLVAWEKAGNMKRLESVRALGEMYVAHLGNGISDMGGTSMAGTQTALAKIFSGANTKVLTDMMKSSITANGHDETQARYEVKQVFNSVDTTFGGPEWEPIYGQIRDMNGKVATNKDEFTAALKETIKALDEETRNYEDYNIQNNLDILNQFKAENNDKQGIVTAINTFVAGTSSAITANKAAKTVNDTRDLMSTYTGMAYEQWKGFGKAPIGDK